ncbi:MAG: iron-sulfur cluster assembly scaffold protein [Alphaproteobacteria bacterium]
MLNDLYSKDVLRLAATITRTDRLGAPDITVSRRAPTCGSSITIDLDIDTDGRVTDYGQDIHACALGQAAASIVAKQVVGKTLGELLPVAEQVRAMLVDGATSPEGDWTAFEALAPVHGYAPRHGAVMLALEAVIDGLGQLAGKPAMGQTDQLTRRS